MYVLGFWFNFIRSHLTDKIKRPFAINFSNVCYTNLTWVTFDCCVPVEVIKLYKTVDQSTSRSTVMSIWSNGQIDKRGIIISNINED